MTVSFGTSPHCVSVDLPMRHQTSTAEGAEAVSLVTSKLGGQLEPFADVSKGYRLAKPLGWNRYDGTTGEYAVKMVDLVDPTTVILLTNSPVKSDTEVGWEAGCAEQNVTSRTMLYSCVFARSPRVRRCCFAYSCESAETRRVGVVRKRRSGPALEFSEVGVAVATSSLSMKIDSDVAAKQILSYTRRRTEKATPARGFCPRCVLHAE